MDIKNKKIREIQNNFKKISYFFSFTMTFKIMTVEFSFGIIPAIF